MFLFVKKRHAASLFMLATVSLLLACFAFLATSIPAAQALTTTPTTMNFQGRLADSSGNIMPDGLYNMKFAMYTVSSGGSSVWNETRENNGTDYRVQVTNGLFSTKLGQVSPIDPSLFASGALYFEITMATPATATCSTTSCASWESPMTPRHEMSTSAYAYNAETLDGYDSSYFAAATGGTGYIQNTTTLQTANFNISGTGTASTLQAAEFDTATQTELTIGGTNATDIILGQNVSLTDHNNLNIEQGSALQTSGVTRLTSDGSLSNIAGYLQTAGDFTIQGVADVSLANNSVSIGASSGGWAERYVNGVNGTNIGWEAVASSSDGNKLVAVAEGGEYIYTSTDSGASWTKRESAGSRDWWSVASSADGSKLVAGGSSTYIYTSDDYGETWVERTSAGSRTWSSLTSSADGTKLAATASSGYVYTSSDSGATWTERTGPGTHTSWGGIASSSDGAKIVAVVWGGYIYTSDDYGATWTEQTSAGSRDWRSVASSADGTKLVAGVYDGYIYSSTNSGATWTERTTSGVHRWFGLASSDDGTKLAAVDYNDGYIYTSTNSGVNWTERTSSGARGWFDVASDSSGDKIVAIAYSDNIHTSTDAGVTWTMQDVGDSHSWMGSSSSSDGSKLVAGDYGGYIYTSSNYGATWTQQTNAGIGNWRSFASSDDGTKLAAVDYGGYIYTSTDSGVNWTQRTTSGSRNWYSIASSADGTKLAAANYGGYIYTSTDSGATWTEQTNSTLQSWRSITSSDDGTKLAAVDTGGYIYTSTDSGVNWTQRTTSGSRNWYAIAGSSDGTKLVAVNIFGYVYTSTDSGANWTERTSSGTNLWYDVASNSDGTILLAVGYGYPSYISTDSGATWTQQTSLGSHYLVSATASSDGTKLMTVGDDGVLYTYGSPATTISLQGNTTSAGDLIVASTKTLTITGGTTATRPSSPTEGMVYYDTTTKQLLTYSNGKWQSDSKTAAVIVAANNSTQAEKDGAQYVGDGTNDDVAINAALAALPAGGGVVYLAGGTYNITASIDLDDDQTLQGSGTNTVLKRMFNSASAEGVVNLSGIDDTVRDLKIDGNKASYTSTNNHGVEVFSSGRQTIDNIHVVNAGGCGIRIATSTGASGSSIINSTVTGSVDSGIYSVGGTDFTIQNNALYSNGGYGMRAGSNDDLVLSANTIYSNTLGGITASGSSRMAIDNNYVYSNSGTGISATADNASITDNVIYANTIGIGIGTGTVDAKIVGNNIKNNTQYGIRADTTGALRTFISSNQVQGNGYDGININNNASGVTVTSNNVHDNGGTGSYSGININLYSGGTDTSVTNNRITDTAGTGYAIRIASGTSAAYLSGNTFSGTGASSISDSGTNTIYEGQSTTAGGLNTLFKQANSTTAFRVQNASGSSLLAVDTSNGKTSFNTTNATGGAVVVEFAQSGTVQGTVSINGATTSYNAFTGSHYAKIDDGTIDMYKLASLTGENAYRAGSNEPIYGVQQSAIANDPNVLGSFLGALNSSQAYSLDNPYLVMAAGNGDVLVADNGSGNVVIGDPLLSSGDVAGYAQRDPGTYDVSHIFAKAAQPVDWSTVTETVGGVKVARISVLFSFYDQQNGGKLLQGSNTMTLNSDMVITGNLAVSGDVDMAAINVSGNGTFGALEVLGATQLRGDLTVSGATHVADIYVNGHIVSEGKKPTVTAGDALGITDIDVAIDGTDGAGTLVMTSGVSDTAAGVLAHVAFDTNYVDDYKVVISPSNAESADLRMYVVKTEDGFDIVSSDTVDAETVYTIDYIVQGVKQTQ